MADGLGRQFPAAVSHRVFAINVGADDLVVSDFTISKGEGAVEIYFDQRPHVSFLGLVQLVVTPAPSVLAVVELVEGVPEYCRDLSAGGVEPVQLCLDGVEFSIRLIWKERLLLHQSENHPSSLLAIA